MSDANDLIGYGYATAFYSTQVVPAECRVTLTPELRAIVEVGTHVIDTGIRTVVAMTASDLLGIPLADVEVRIGDSRLPAAPMSAGSNSTAGVCTVVAKACESIRQRIAQAAVKTSSSPLKGRPEESVRLIEGKAISGEVSGSVELAVKRADRGKLIVQNASNNPHGAPPLIGPALVKAASLSFWAART